MWTKALLECHLFLKLLPLTFYLLEWGSKDPAHLAVNQPSAATKMWTDPCYNVIALSTIVMLKNNKEKSLITDGSIFYIQIEKEES